MLMDILLNFPFPITKLEIGMIIIYRKMQNLKSINLQSVSILDFFHTFFLFLKCSTETFVSGHYLSITVQTITYRDAQN